MRKGLKKSLTRKFHGIPAFVLVLLLASAAVCAAYLVFSITRTVEVKEPFEVNIWREPAEFIWPGENTSMELGIINISDREYGVIYEVIVTAPEGVEYSVYLGGGAVPYEPGTKLPFPPTEIDDLIVNILSHDDAEPGYINITVNVHRSSWP